MISTRVKELIINFLVIFCVIIVLVTINFKIYDFNGFSRYFDNKLYKFFKKKDISKFEDKDKYYLINIKNKLESREFLYILQALIENGSQSIIIDLNSNFLKDEIFVSNIEKIINERDNIFGLIPLKNKKGISINYSEYSNDINFEKNLMNFKQIDKYALFLSNYKNKLNNSILFNIRSDKVGFINDEYNYLDSNNIDFIYKFNDRYLVSLPFLFNFYKRDFKIEDIRFGYLKFLIYNVNFYYDQKGRLTYIHDLNNIFYNFIDFSDFEKSLQSRIDAMDLLTELDLIDINIKNEDFFEKEKNIINNIYNFEELKNEEKNNKLNEAKKLATLWNGYKKANSDKFKNSIIFISDNNSLWINNFIHQKRIISMNINLFRIPVEIILISMIFLFLFIILLFLNRKVITFYIVFFTVVFLFLNIALFFILRIFLNIDFPLSALIITLAVTLITGFLLKMIDSNIWLFDLRLIFKDRISKNYALKIIDLLKSKKWSFAQKEHLCTFLDIDLTDILNIKINEDYVDLISKLNTDISDFIKNRYGIINEFKNTSKIAFFGNPRVTKNHAYDAVECAREIFQKINPTFIEKNNFTIAVHSKNEWFKLLNSEFGKNYIYIGQSENILQGLQKYAKKFNIKIIITDIVYKLCNLNLPVRMLDKVRITDINKTFRLFELLTKDEYQAKEEFINYFHAGLKLFENKKWNDSNKYFKQCLKIDENDIPSKIYIERCREYAYVEPLDNWDGVFEIDIYS
ncbi:MAG: hypothetical protein JXB50_15090 [Spirochaetes bacterium]|nr:hypothetical protein [Spirochaetota bacterium]